ncbi:MAG TPA: hypothetical protein VJM12_16480 [Pyrinomonadaceae bacterium]|nr:hypothetical protein [Pyrinomonadaceae bacterium]
MSRKTFPFVLVFGMLLATNVVAQTSQELVANIPFSFTVCQEQLPAGKYKVRPVTSANPRVVLIATENNRPIEMICTHDVQGKKPSTTGKLIFNRYGNQYFLSELWVQGETTGRQLGKTEEEEALFREARGTKKREKVTVKVIELKPE